MSHTSHEECPAHDTTMHRPAEASRAIRKKLKHGNAHQQYRALVASVCSIQVAVVILTIRPDLEGSCGELWRQIHLYDIPSSLISSAKLVIGTASFADDHLTDAIKNLSADHAADMKVRKKLMAVLASWQEQFQSDPSMSTVAGLYKQCIREGRYQTYQGVAHPGGAEDNKKEQAKARNAEGERQQGSRQNVGNHFVFEKVQTLLARSGIDVNVSK